MSFENAQRHYEDLIRRKKAGTLDERQFATELAKIRVKDENGYTWCLDPQGGWLYWNGSDWVSTKGSGKQPQQAADGVGEAAAAHPDGSTADIDRVLRKGIRWIPMLIGVLRGRLPPISVFMQQMRHVPLKKRPQPWWDALAIMGGAAGGLLWLLYSSVRGMPHITVLQLQHESFFDFLPPLLMAVGAVLLFLLRRKVARLLRSVLLPLRKIPLVGRFGLGGFFLVAGLLIRYKSGLFQTREGLDLITPLLMLMLPVCIVFFRKPLDTMLLPFDPIRSKIPRIVLVCVGLAVPFLVSHILYHWFNMMMYPFLRASVVIGTMVSYAIIRTPVRPPSNAPKMALASSSSPPADPQNQIQRRMAWIGLAWIVAVHFLLVSPAFGDDFLRDPFNGNDGLRTNGVATAIAGTVTIIVSGLVNGAEVVRTVLEASSEGSGAAGGAGAGAAGTGGKNEEKEPRKIQIEVETVDASGAVGTRLEKGVNDVVFIYASCFEVGKGALPEMDDTIVFSLNGGAPFVFLHDHGRAHGRRCAAVQLEEPAPNEAPPSTANVTVSASIEGARISVPVSLELVVALYRIRFR